MKETGCEFLKRICAIAKGLPKSQWDRFEYKGDRGKLVLKILNEGDAGQGDGEAEIFPESGDGGGSGGGGSSSASASAGSGHSAGHRGMGDMDVNGQGMLETYTRKLKQVQENFGEDIDLSSEDAPKIVVKKLVIDPATCVTGEQGGKLLACYLYSLTDGPTWGTMLGPAFLERGAIPFLEKQLVKLQLFPSAKSLIEHSISFYPKLVQGLVLARAARETAAELDFGDDDDDSAGAGTAVPPRWTSARTRRCGRRRRLAWHIPLGRVARARQH